MTSVKRVVLPGGLWTPGKSYCLTINEEEERWELASLDQCEGCGFLSPQNPCWMCEEMNDENENETDLENPRSKNPPKGRFIPERCDLGRTKVSQMLRSSGQGPEVGDRFTGSSTGRREAEDESG